MLGNDKIILLEIFRGPDFCVWVKLVNWTYFILDLVIFVVVLIFWTCRFCFRF